MRFFQSCLLLLACLFPFNLQAEKKNDLTDLVDSANAYLDALTEDQLEVTMLPFDSAEREDWHYFPKRRKGLAWHDMNPKQKELSWALFDAALSHSGQAKARGVVQAEAILWERSNHADHRSPEKYHVSIFGKPAPTANWGASLEGHHLSINLTVVEGRKVFVTPSFYGANPDHTHVGENQEFYPLKDEAESALQLLQSLNTEQRKSAVISDKPIREILTGADRKVSPLPDAGLSAADMTEVQQKHLRRLIAEYIDRYRASFVKKDWAKIEAAGFDSIHFAWAGSDQLGEPMYYRVQGPTFIMEYANVQNRGNHSHTVWRDFENDFGRDVLQQHISSSH